MIPLLALIFAAAPALGMSHTEMPLCPSSPNCISSEAQDNHSIEPFPIIGGSETSFDKLRAILDRRSDTKIVFENNYNFDNRISKLFFCCASTSINTLRKHIFEQYRNNPLINIIINV